MYFVEMTLLSTFILLSGIFTVILGILFIPAMLELMKPSGDVTLPIDENQTNNPRQDAFRLRKIFQDSDPFSKMAPKHFQPTGPLKGTFREILLITAPMQAENESKFLVEAYLQSTGTFGSKCSIHKLICDDNLILGPSTTITGWVDAEGDLQIGENSNIQNKATSAKTISIEKNCSFKSLFAHPIQSYHFAGEPSEEPRKKACTISQMAIYVSPGLTTIPPNTTITQDLIVKGDLEIGTGCHFEKSIKCSGKITLEANVTVKGNIFADKDIMVGRGSKIGGDVFSQQIVFLKDHVIVGEKGKIKSVIGIQGAAIENDVKIYGYLHTYGHGNIS